MNRSSSSPEYKAIIKCTRLLIKEIAIDVSSIANELVSRDFISSSNWEEITNTSNRSTNDAATLLFKSISNRIELNPEKFHLLVEILQMEKCRESTAQFIEEKYEEFCQTQSNQSQRSFSISNESYRGNEDDYFKRPSKRRHSYHSSTADSSSREVFDNTDQASPQHPHKAPTRPDDVMQDLNGSTTSNNTRRPSIDIELKSDEALKSIADVTINSLRNLGTQLGIESPKLDEIDAYPVEERRTQLIKVWFEIEENPSWDKLTRALQNPSVLENRAAEKACSIRRGISYEASVPESPLSPCDPSKADATGVVVPFTEATVLDAFTPISNIFELGQLLAIPDHILHDIKTKPIEEHRQRLVAALYRVRPKCSWEEVNVAINRVRVAEWASRKENNSSLTKSSSFDSVSQFSSISMGAKSEDMSRTGTLEKQNVTDIRSAHSRLVNTVITQLKNIEPDMKEFYMHIISIFEDDDVASCVSDEDDIYTIFQKLTKHRFWSFRNIANLKSIAKYFLDEDVSLKEKFTVYDQKLNGYKANTKIIDMIRRDEIKECDEDENEDEEEYESIASNPGKYTRKYRVTLQKKIFRDEGGRVTLHMKSLEYIESVWNELCDLFNMSITSVLDKIREGCIEVVWLIPYSSAHIILERIHRAEEFFQRKFISNVLIEGIPIYSESCGVATEKTFHEAQLLLAVQSENFEKVHSLFLGKFCGDVNAEVTKTDKTVMMVAAHSGSVTITSTLLEHGAKVDAQDVYGWSALFYATNGDHIETVNCLYDHGATITLKSKNNTSVLDLAHKQDANEVYRTLKTKLELQLIKSAKEGETAAVERILSMGVDHLNVDTTDPEKELWTPLMWSSWHGHSDTVHLLLKYKPNVNVAAIKGWAPLILASREGHCQVMNDLLDHGADIDQQASGGWSSLLMAAARGRTEAGRILVKNGAKVECPEQGGYTPFAQAAQDGHPEFVKMMIDEVPYLDINIITKGTWTPLMLAAKNGHTRAANILMENGADIDAQKSDNVNALHIASYAGYNDIVLPMIRNKTDVNAQDEHGVTALMFAVKQGHSKVVDTLVLCGKADINLQENAAKFTAPFFAVKCKHNKMVETFLRNDKIDLGITDLEGNTILDIAEKHNPEVLDIIRKQFDKMKLTPRMNKPGSSSSAAAEPRSSHVSKLTSKTAFDYIDSMLKNIDLRMGGVEIAASAA